MKFLNICAAVMSAVLFACCETGAPNVGDTYESGTSAPDILTSGAGETYAVEDQITEIEKNAENTVGSGSDPEIAYSGIPGTESAGYAESTADVGASDAPESAVTSMGYAITNKDGVTYVNGVLIANKTYPLPESYAPGGLTDETYSAFAEMQAAASMEGIYLFVKSGYRSFTDQSVIYAGYADRDGSDLADRYSARAGYSEHQSGMAIDVNSVNMSFAYTPEGIWLREHCADYGFIIRYPEEKEQITGYMYEPWHIRYLGVELARAVTDSGLCLEEYFGITSSYE